MHVLVAVVVGLALAGSFLRSFVAGTPDIATAATVFCGIFVQAIPFLALGILVSGAVAAFVTPDRLARRGDPGRRRRRGGATRLRMRVGAHRPPPLR